MANSGSTIEIPVSILKSMVAVLTDEQLGRVLRTFYWSQAENINSAKTLSITFQKQKARERTEFAQPSKEEVIAYFKELGSTEDEALMFYFRNESSGWFVAGKKMKDWRSAIKYWLRNQKKIEQNGFKSKYQRQVEQQQQFGAALAEQCVNNFQAESQPRGSGEGGYLPPEL